MTVMPVEPRVMPTDAVSVRLPQASSVKAAVAMVCAVLLRIVAHAGPVGASVAMTNQSRPSVASQQVAPGIGQTCEAYETPVIWVVEPAMVTVQLLPFVETMVPWRRRMPGLADASAMAETRSFILMRLLPL